MNPQELSHLGQISAAAGMGLSAVGLGVGVGLIFASFIQAIARQPELESKLMTWTFVGAAMVEGVAIFCAIMCFLAIHG
jgi:F-type H+-transporting ATPase subunit c